MSCCACACWPPRLKLKLLGEAALPPPNAPPPNAGALACPNMPPPVLLKLNAGACVWHANTLNIVCHIRARQTGRERTREEKMKIEPPPPPNTSLRFRVI